MNCCVESADNILNSNTNRVLCPILIRQKIPRPPNAFMLYANEHRKTLAHLYPADSNKEISRRLGQTWKDLSLQEKNKYFQKAKDIDQEHKRKYPGYVYNPKDARMRKAIRTTLRDRSIGASPVLPRPCMRSRPNNVSSVDFYQNLIMPNPLAQFEKQSPMWNGLCDQLENSQCFSDNQTNNNNILTPSDKSSTVTSEIKCENDIVDTSGQIFESPQATLPLNLIESSEEERTLFEREKTNLEAAESYTKIGKYEEFMKSSYLPISTTKFITDPELFTNNVEYHKEYIIKYFNHIPDYETYNVTTEDGITFPYVTIPNLVVRQNVAGVSYN